MKTLQSHINEALQAGDKLGYNSKIDSIVEGDAVYVRTADDECLIDRKDLLELIDTAKENNLNKVVFDSNVHLAPVHARDKEFDFGGLKYVFNKELDLRVVPNYTVTLSNGTFEVLGGMYYVRGVDSTNDTVFENMHITCNKLKTSQTLMPELKRSTWKCSEILMNVDLWQPTIDTMLCNCDICKIEDEGDAKLWAEKRNLLEYDTPLIKVNVGLSHTIDFTKRGNKISVPEIDSENMRMANFWYKSKQYKQYLKSKKIY